MSQENQISTAIPAETLADINTKLNAINTSLVNTLLFNLTADERKSMRIMGDKSIVFVQKALEYAENNQALIPSYLDLSEAKKRFRTCTRSIWHITTIKYLATCCGRYHDGSWKRSLRCCTYIL